MKQIIALAFLAVAPSAFAASQYVDCFTSTGNADYTVVELSIVDGQLRTFNGPSEMEALEEPKVVRNENGVIREVSQLRTNHTSIVADYVVKGLDQCTVTPTAALFVYQLDDSGPGRTLSQQVFCSCTVRE